MGNRIFLSQKLTSIRFEMKTKRGVGGAAHQVALGGVGSSPAVSIKTTNIHVLRKMLQLRDRNLYRWDNVWKHKLDYHWFESTTTATQFQKWDAERRFIRERIKSLSFERRSKCYRLNNG